ncbi:hypothetical protein sscle_05g041170 [Sclerotinia sclerotiorum 1980 UF-70]|uniref:Uncharacterized protein n=1 Tax=Sclerotinia sclerotiorum (strain ATCC 18683 / 1980 / Ss-1) TaxID=665079 RepID=A0A1D9Q333_SCLS1|nr:hypothetical protein sscle_05g041170 [Sclerotinia sclerotiorum 1980 UF-70]
MISASPAATEIYRKRTLRRPSITYTPITNIYLKQKTRPKENSALNEEVKLLEIGHISAADVTILQQKLESSEQWKQHYEGLAAKFRTIIRISNTIDIDDTVIAAEFRWLRIQIEHIIHTNYSMSKKPLAPERVKLRNAQMRLCHIFTVKPNEHGLQARMRAFVFRHLDEPLLSKGSFGLEDKNLAMEQELQNFETSFSKNHPDRHAELADWRTVTMKCAQYL